MVTLQYIEGVTSNNKAFVVAMNQDGSKFLIQTQLGIRSYRTVLETDDYDEAVSRFDKAEKLRKKSGHKYRKFVRRADYSSNTQSEFIEVV